MQNGLLTKLKAFDASFSGKYSPGLYLAGIDEAGRGPLAGPVVAAAVILVRNFAEESLNDSKQVSSKKRSALFLKILQNSVAGIGVAAPEEIDRINIYQATRLAMRRAVLSLSVTPSFLLIDGNMKIDVPIPQESVIKGDTKSASIAAASILAKVYRDAHMSGLDQMYPGYFFSRHKGYGTRVHLDQLKLLGPSPAHRRSFSPVADLLNPVADEKMFQDQK